MKNDLRNGAVKLVNNPRECSYPTIKYFGKNSSTSDGVSGLKPGP